MPVLVGGVLTASSIVSAIIMLSWHVQVVVACLMVGQEMMLACIGWPIIVALFERRKTLA
ncbi:hypothetical protein [Swingsia samuiensis]|uniref:Uncharacterized protein n=1 Tax=Swingsia samuiensis TaxID=1293412 RepID=A0A4Y6UJM9_9PROT|nr:hypothetical protein [Swingsia samuiensis]QDH16676.1 hypothetical protein E3D00_03110 [Swingsia samuiensis]